MGKLVRPKFPHHPGMKLKLKNSQHIGWKPNSVRLTHKTHSIKFVTFVGTGYTSPG